MTVAGEEVARVGTGLCLFLGVAKDDTAQAAAQLAEKALALRIFEDGSGKFNRSVAEVGGEILLVSEFTLYGDCSRGRRPSFDAAAPARDAEVLYNHFLQKLRQSGLKVASGKFQTKMEVSLTNDGPVTFLLDSR